MISLVDLTRQVRALEPSFQKALERVLKSGQFILGPEVDRFEREFARFCGSRFGVGVASGTDALELGLRAVGVGRGDLVATVSFTFLATVDAILHVGASPLFVDIDPDTFTMDPNDLEDRLRRLPARRRRRVKAVIPVHLFGHPCDMTAILRTARRHRLSVIEDCAQAAGAKWKGRPVGSLGDLGCFSFFPSKTLGGFGDGGMVVTRSARLADRLRQLRVHGRNGAGNQTVLGRNSRLDEVQAALLRVKLAFLRRWVARRRALATEYSRALSKVDEVDCPLQRSGARHAYSLYVIRTSRQNALGNWLRRRGVSAAVYYALPVHRQPLHRARFGKTHLPESQRAARQVLALPLYPELRISELRRICWEVSRFFDSPS